MAIGNLFQGTAAGRIGDTVFYRKSGNQHSRLRIRKPYNPRTNAQLYQRAIVATVMQAYSAGSEIFDHSFQGYRKGEANYRRFLSLNTRILRSLVANDINNLVSEASQQGRVVAPKTMYAVPFNGLQISEGTYKQQAFIEEQAAGAQQIEFHLPPHNNGETRIQYSQRIGLVANDLYTFVGFEILHNQQVFVAPGAANDFGIQYASKLVILRLRVMESFVSSHVEMTEGTKLYSIFEPTFKVDADVSFLENYAYNEPIFLHTLGDDALGAIGLIRSRTDVDLRSTSFMHSTGMNKNYGLISAYLIPAWNTIRGGGELIDSTLILEGGDGTT